MPVLPADATERERRAAAADADRRARADEQRLMLVALSLWRAEARTLDAALARAARSGDPRQTLAVLSAARRAYAAPDGMYYKAWVDGLTPPLTDAAVDAATRIVQQGERARAARGTGAPRGAGSQAVQRARRAAETAARAQAEAAAAEIGRTSARPVAAAERLVRDLIRTPAPAAPPATTATTATTAPALPPPPVRPGPRPAVPAPLPPPEGVWAQRLATLEPLLGKTLAGEVISSVRRGVALGVKTETIALSITRQARSSGKIAERRATLIATTEAHGARRSGEHQGALAAGMQRKRWRTTLGERSRQAHKDCEREGWIPIDATFQASGLEYPGQRPAPPEQVINCACLLEYLAPVGG